MRMYKDADGVLYAGKKYRKSDVFVMSGVKNVLVDRLHGEQTVFVFVDSGIVHQFKAHGDVSPRAISANSVSLYETLVVGLRRTCTERIHFEPDLESITQPLDMEFWRVSE